MFCSSLVRPASAFQSCKDLSVAACFCRSGGSKRTRCSWKLCCAAEIKKCAASLTGLHAVCINGIAPMALPQLQSITHGSASCNRVNHHGLFCNVHLSEAQGPWTKHLVARSCCQGSHAAQRCCLRLCCYCCIHWCLCPAYAPGKLSLSPMYQPVTNLTRLCHDWTLLVPSSSSTGKQ